MQRTIFTMRPEALCALSLAALVSCQDAVDSHPTSDPVADRELTQAPGSARMIDVGHALAVPDEYIVVFRDGVPPERTGAAIQATRSRGTNVKSTYTVIPGFAGRFTPAELAELARDPDVAYIEANKYVSINAVFNNPTYGLDRIDQRQGTNNQYDDFGFDGSGAHVYVIDTGLRTTHNEFTGRVGNGFSALDNDPSVQDCQGHGTHVASIVAGTRFGVAKKAVVHPVRVLDCAGNGTEDDVIQGMDWVRLNRLPMPSIVNMSLGGPGSQAINDAVQNLTNANVVVVVAAGNSFGTNACNQSPAGSPSALTIAATSPGEIRAPFSDVGPCVDLFAPGVNVVGAGIRNNNDTATMSGTSQASPHVAGAVATYLQRFPRLTTEEITKAVIASATGGIVGDPRGSANLFLYTNFGTPVPNSCFGRCDGQSADFSCACDDVCEFFGDCCFDKQMLCQ